MKKILSISMSFLVVLSTFSILLSQFKAEGNNILLASSTCITDATDDWIGGTGLDYMDITSACIVGIDYWTVRFEMAAASEIPEDPSPRSVGYVWALDLDRDEMFTEFPPYAPDYTDLNVRVAFFPGGGWEGYIDGKPGPSIVHTSFSIEANTVSFTLSLSLIYDTKSFLWQASTVGAIDGTNLPYDIAPNYGLPLPSWMRAPAPVGGVWSRIDKFQLLAPYICLASLVTIATISIAYVKYRKKKQT